MDVTLLGTGGPAGLPRPGCPCACCARAVGEHVRAPTSVLVDGVLLIGPGPDPWPAAARAGRSLASVRQVLPGRPGGPGNAAVPGLPPPLRPDGPERLPTGHRVRPLRLDRPGTGWDITGPDGTRLLYLPSGSGPATSVTAPGPPFDRCLLDVTGRPDVLARLRATGAAGPATDVLAVHLDHDMPPGPGLTGRLSAAGARALPDGSTAGPADGATAAPRRTLVLGGARSGKSLEAERRLAAAAEVHYVATGGRRGGDREWGDRIAAHRERRPPGWTTLETCDLLPLLARGDGPPLLVDCLALWLTDAMDSVGAWDDHAWREGGEQALAERTGALAAALRHTRRTVVAVSNEAGSGVVPATASGRRFRDALGRLNAAVAAECEQVLLVTAGIVQRLR
ncbi:bifunctional adenosylcobinamide kinase/adenosylcobinamide-phosphate guanylyltransferase [Streptomyces sodiiphilus]|uniref:Adenosylcobinamide kinase n=1 Tax=Streptomyces sodiiphilus TaxID=226217 RepID=A0ABN2PWJ7_9ACTN